MAKPLLRDEEVSDGINVVIDDRFCAMFPMESRAQVNQLVKYVNLAHEQRMSDGRESTKPI